ncbi:MAG: microcin C ABC transporter permease YejB, partial [Pseudomonadota bacterium]
MGAYILRRLLLILPTLFGIMLINFTLVQFVPGGPIEQIIAELNDAEDATARFAGGADAGVPQGEVQYQGARGLPEDFIKELEEQFGLDKPPVERFFLMLGSYLVFDFGESYLRSISVVDLIIEKLPVSITLGLWSTLIAYLVSIPLGIRKAVRDGSRFDTWTSSLIIFAYAIPGFLFAILLLVLFAGGSYFQIFPSRGLGSSNWEELSFFGKVVDYLWHIALPVTASTISAFATLTLLTKNSFLDEIRKQYVITARAKGVTETRVLYGHVFRNAMLIVIAGFPALFVSVFFTGSLIIETIFSLDGLGRLGFEAVVQRDYPVVFGTLYIFGLIGLIIGLLS